MQKMLEARSSLPISKFKSNILQLLVENDVIVVCGETGCGKTTQVVHEISINAKSIIHLTSMSSRTTNKHTYHHNLLNEMLRVPPH